MRAAALGRHGRGWGYRHPKLVRGCLMCCCLLQGSLALGCLVLALGPGAASGFAQASQAGDKGSTPTAGVTAAPAPQASGKAVPESRTAYLAQLRNFAGLLSACEASDAACDTKAIGPDVAVGAADAPSSAAGEQAAFTMNFGWLRETLAQAHTTRGAERQLLFNEARTRLDEETAAAGGSSADAVGAAAPAAMASDARLGQAARKADEILRTREFSHVEHSSWLSLQLAALAAILDRLLGSARDLLPRSNHLGILLEWSILGAAALSVGLWAWRATRRERVLFAAERTPAQGVARESERWAERAEAEAARGAWRDAVHSLFWSAIVLLEGERLWRQNGARTPREYLGLLQPGTVRRQALGGLTRIFERIWYGLRPAGETDYEQARALLDQLKAG